MNLKQRYRIRGKKRIARFIITYLFVASILLFYSTFARYTTVVEEAPSIGIANWKIQLNNESIDNEVELSNVISLIPNTTTQTTKDNKLAPGQSGYFDIIINPETTGVALEYTITFNTTNLPEGMILTTYEIVEDSVLESIEDNTILGEITLNEALEELAEEDTKTIRINWEWAESSNEELPIGTEKYNISAIITFKQKLS